MSNSNMVIHNSTLLNTAVRNSQISHSSVIGGEIGVGSNPPLGGWRLPNPNTWEPKQHWSSRHKNYLRQPQEMFPSSGFSPYQYVPPTPSLQSASMLTGWQLIKTKLSQHRSWHCHENRRKSERLLTTLCKL